MSSTATLKAELPGLLYLFPVSTLGVSQDERSSFKSVVLIICIYFTNGRNKKKKAGVDGSRRACN